MTQPLKLTVEPVPVTSAGKSLSALMPRHRWRTLGRRVAAEYGRRCAVCGVDPKDAPAGVRGRHAPALDHPDLLARYGDDLEERMRQRMVEEGWRGPGRVSLHCHEEWEYDDGAGVQRLSGLCPLCSRCHLVKHWYVAATRRLPVGGRLVRGERFGWHATGELRSWGYAQEFALRRAINPHVYHREDHFMWVNDCGIDALIEHVEEAAEVCSRRSQREWRVDFGEFAEMLDG